MKTDDMTFVAEALLALCGENPNPPPDREPGVSTLADFEPDFDSMINLDALGGFDESGFGGGMMQGESGGFALDMDWMNGVGGADGLGGEPMGADVMI